MSPTGVPLLFPFWVVNSLLYFPWLLSPSLHLCYISLCVAPVALAIVFMPGLYPTAYRATFPAFFMRLALVCFYCLCVFVYVLYFIATMSFAGYFLPVLFCMLSMLISDSRLIWFGSVYLVTTARFVAYQSMWDKRRQTNVPWVLDYF